MERSTYQPDLFRKMCGKSIAVQGNLFEGGREGKPVPRACVAHTEDPRQLLLGDTVEAPEEPASGAWFEE